MKAYLYFHNPFTSIGCVHVRTTPTHIIFRSKQKNISFRFSNLSYATIQANIKSTITFSTPQKQCFSIVFFRKTHLRKIIRQFHQRLQYTYNPILNHL